MLPAFDQAREAKVLEMLTKRIAAMQDLIAAWRSEAASMRIRKRRRVCDTGGHSPSEVANRRHALAERGASGDRGRLGIERFFTSLRNRPLLGRHITMDLPRFSGEALAHSWAGEV